MTKRQVPKIKAPKGSIGYRYVPIRKHEYEGIAECILTDQVSPRLIAEYFEDKPFFEWFKKTHRWF